MNAESSRGFSSAARVACAIAAVVLATGRAEAEPVDCQRAIARASAAYVQARARDLLACEQKKLQGRLPAGTDCASEPGVAAKLGDARERLAGDVARACGGADRTCGTADDDSLASIGWPAECPNLENGSCDDPITHCGDVAACLACIDAAAVDQAIELTHGSLAAGTSGDRSLSACQREIGKATTRFLLAKSKALRACWDQRLAGRHADVCPNPGADPRSPAGKAAAAIARAEARKVEDICRACGGVDRACGGGDDLTTAAIGFVPSCTDVTVPGGAACGAITSIDELGEIVACVGCVAEFKVDCMDRAAVPGLAAYPEECSVSVPPGPADDVACQRAIAKATSLYARDRARALARCEQDKIRGRLPAAIDCASEPRAHAQIARAAEKLERDLARGCGGADRTCGTADDSTLGAIGWPARCPDFAGRCDAPLSGCDDVAACLVCVADAGVDQAIAVAHGGAAGAGEAAAARCRQAIGKATTDFFRAKSQALQTCWDARLRGAHAASCPDADADPRSPAGKAAAAIAKAEARKVDTICRACGGADRACGGGDDLPLAELGFAASCVAVTVPDGPSCGAISPIDALGELVQCVDCAADFDADCIDRAAVPALASYPGECLAAVGPTPTPTPTPASTPTPTATPTPTPTATPTPTPTVPPPPCTSQTVRVATSFVPPVGDPVSGVTTLVDYPQSRATIPGTGSDAEVQSRVANLTGVAGGIFSVFDSSADLNVGLVNLAAAIPPGPFAEVQLDCVPGAAAPAASDYACTATVSTFNGFFVPATCAVSIVATVP